MKCGLENCSVEELVIGRMVIGIYSRFEVTCRRIPEISSRISFSDLYENDGDVFNRVFLLLSWSFARSLIMFGSRSLN